jgi:hypothetical protein
LSTEKPTSSSSSGGPKSANDWPRIKSRWRTHDGKTVVVVGDSAGQFPEAADRPTFIHYVIVGETGVKARRTVALRNWGVKEKVNGQYVPRFTPLPDVREGESWESVHDTAESLRPFLAEFASHRRTFPPVSNRASAVFVMDKLRSETSCNASDRAMTFLWGVLEAFRLCGVLNDHDVEAYRERLRHCPGHAGQGWCAICADICSHCGEADPCGQEDCAVARFGDGPRPKGYPQKPDEQAALANEIADRQ